MTSVPSPRFDRARAAEAALHYAESTGVACVAMDADGHVVSGSSDNDRAVGCVVCRSVPGLVDAGSSCLQAHLYGSFQSMRFGGRYTYFCPLGLTYTCAPIIADARLAGSLVAGPVLLVDRAELAAEIRVKHGLSVADHDRLVDSLRAVPEVSPARARSLGETLLYTASWVSGVNVQALVLEEERLSRESRVSDYIHDLKTMGGGEAVVYSAATEKELLQAIREGDRDAAQEVLAELLATIRVASGEDLATVKARVLELVVLLSRAAIDGGADAESVFGINYRALREIHGFSRVSELTRWVSQIAARFVQFVFDVRSVGLSDAVTKATWTMRRRLHEKIGLEEVAREVRLSPSYFSRVFREETGATFTSYLSGLRIEKAKQLLSGSDLTILEVALEVGFSDQSHFSRVFRKLAGVTPARYRNRAPYPRDTQEIHDGLG